ncbi:MAG: type IV toxin-antitoxin system AbiEi family antitoxin domain-containing protein [Candidatus Methanofastidiosa archaeon]|nr:type IV toxin-antitoxin system AbiEi family antitoxin domain-containing protein [Candidatus Methanofastidiosa archaeon]
MEKGFLKTILRSDQTVFTFKDFLLMWGGIDVKTAKVRINYYVKSGDLYSIRRGIYAKDQDYDRFELATKIFTPAYISLETVLGIAGVTFQYYGQIFVASYQTKEIVADGQKIVFKTFKDSILTNSVGIEKRDHYAIASPERAFLDAVYLYKDYYFDNLGALDWEKVNEIVPVYGNNKRMSDRVNEYYQIFQEEENDPQSSHT